MKFKVTFLFFFFTITAFSQESDSNFRQKTVAINDSIKVDSVSINSYRFFIELKDSTVIDTSYYSIDFAKAILTLKKPIKADSIIINYLKFPEFLTKTYQQFDETVIIENNNKLNKLYKIKQPNTGKEFSPFDGLTTSGSISRGVTIGNNQNSVLNSELDLQITGKLNDKVSLRASIQDANIPLQESGYSQRLDEFDQVFVEIFSDQWNIRAGDVDLENNDSYFSEFSKRVQGLSLKTRLGDEDSRTNLFAAGALVRGQFTTSQFTAQEGNQGPYKLQGQNGELFVLIVSGSETVYVNGVAVKRGENEDYIIDYNAGEIIFNSTFPINSEMRITVDYQFSDRNYSRLVAYGGGSYQTEKFKIGASVYSENDAKNNPLQQNLSTEQVGILSEAGDNRALMVAPSEVEEAFNENRILYKKENINGVEAFVYSNNPDDTLFSVRFTNVGDNQGNYKISNINAINTIYEYVEPNTLGEPQGNFEPIVQLVAPVKLQVAVVNGSYTPTEKTSINFEFAGSKNDLNLFSNIDDNNNNGFAGKLNINQSIIKQDSLWNLDAFVDTDYIQEEFRNIEGLYNPEFNRDWNINATTTNGLNSNFGDQVLFSAGTRAFHDKKGNANYLFEHLGFSNTFSGNKHTVNAKLFLNEKLTINTNSSILNSNATESTSTFFRTYNDARYNFKKSWIGGRFSAENNEQKETETNNFTDLSQRFNAYEIYTGVGDSTGVFAEVGYKYRVNDSVRDNNLQRVNKSNTYYLNSRLIKNERTNLSLFANYRTLKNTDVDVEDEQSLNSRLLYSQQFFKNMVNWNTVFETNSGTLAQQDFTYVEVEPGQGAYTWNDYNGNGIQEIEEFEIAQFQDQGQYIRVLLPNQIFIKTHQNRLSQALTLNPANWINETSKTKKFWSHFYNQSSYLIDRKIKREGNTFNLNPFEEDEDNQLGLQLNFRNVLFYNRGKQRYTTSYTYLNNQSRNILSFVTSTANAEDVSFIANTLKSHQFNFNHKFATSWLINFLSSFDVNESVSNNFVSKNFKIDEESFNPKLSYLLNDNVRFDVFYQYTNKANTIGDLETLNQQKYGFSFAITKNVKSAISGEFNVFANTFEGNANSPVGYQMLEGLQPGKNLTWSVLAQQKITKFLDLNLTYFGRKTETSKTIHTGNVQLKAYF
ncbi:hypothetical protein [Lacinutrix venerupis]|uniref:Outer membrane beta-barrel protein n=1 Tax=Lacinutrix venerupis TaxID=1486034 RepID=A0AAC9LK02_9FLAO|nr:hypothetical protein [Lacinutrix venerupis]APX98759.1 hypothetical protein BWR22_00035 [Lacinutrix venerupis]